MLGLSCSGSVGGGQGALSDGRGWTSRVPVATSISVVLSGRASLVTAGLRVLISSLPGFRVVDDGDDIDAAADLRVAWTSDPAEAAIGPRWARNDTLVPAVWIAPTWTPEQGRAALAAGARGCLTEAVTVEELAAALRQAAHGDIALSRDVAGPLVALLATAPSRTERPRDPISPREREVLTLVCEGLGNKAIAQRLYLSLRTVENHLAAVFDKLGVSSRTEAAVLAIRNGWVSGADAAALPAGMGNLDGGGHEPER